MSRPAPAASASAVLRCGGLAMRVTCPGRGDLAWLIEFFSPTMSAAADGPADVEVRWAADGPRFAALRAAGRSGPPEESFVVDDRVVRLPRWETDLETGDLLAEGDGVLFRAAEDRSAYEVITGDAAPRGRTRVMRVARELAMAHGCARGVLLRAACVAHGGRGHLLAAPTAGGKTSALTGLLAVEGAAYVANDRVRALDDDGGLRLSGMPVVVHLREDMLARMPDLRRRLDAARDDPRLALGEAVADGPPPRRAAGGTRALSPAQYCRALGVPIAGAQAAGALLFPVVTGRPGGWRLRPCPPDEARERLAPLVYGVGHLRAARPFFRLPGAEPPGADVLAARTRRLPERMPAFRLELGTDAWHDASGARAILAGLAASS